MSPHDALRLLKQPRGDTRSAVRSADYMAQTLRLMHDRVHHVHKRSLNATGQTCTKTKRRSAPIAFASAFPGLTLMTEDYFSNFGMLEAFKTP